MSTDPANSAPLPRLDGRRVLLAMLLTPVLPAFYAAILLADPWLLPFGLAAAYPCELLFAMPLLLLLRIKGHSNVLWHMFAGAAAAVPAVGAYAWFDPIEHVASFDAVHAVYMVGWGVFAGACFWLIAVAGETPLRWRNLFDAGPPG